MADETNALNKNLVLVIDGVVVENLNCDERLAAILMSQPQVVDISGLNYRPDKGWRLLRDGSFVAPAE